MAACCVFRVCGLQGFAQHQVGPTRHSWSPKHNSANCNEPYSSFRALRLRRTYWIAYVAYDALLCRSSPSLRVNRIARWRVSTHAQRQVLRQPKSSTAKYLVNPSSMLRSPKETWRTEAVNGKRCAWPFGWMELQMRRCKRPRHAAAQGNPKRFSRFPAHLWRKVK